VCITGALSRPREDYEKMLLQAGAKLSTGVTSRTHFLVCNEKSGSSKYKKAEELNVPVLTEVEFVELLGGLEKK
jgi:DNA ligase (NAD+)